MGNCSDMQSWYCPTLQSPSCVTVHPDWVTQIPAFTFTFALPKYDIPTLFDLLLTSSIDTLGENQGCIMDQPTGLTLPANMGYCNKGAVPDIPPQGDAGL